MFIEIINENIFYILLAFNIQSREAQPRKTGAEERVARYLSFNMSVEKFYF